jgi:hypothetical protein
MILILEKSIINWIIFYMIRKKIMKLLTTIKKWIKILKIFSTIDYPVKMLGVTGDINFYSFILLI